VHEADLARRILAEVLRHAEAAGAARVTEVVGSIAEDEALSAESLRMSFERHAEGTLASGARLVLRLRHVEARCGACGTTFAPHHHVRLCPACGGLGELTGPTGVAVDHIEVA
jgi:hydrogenase nickel incorporation protein HypA/HybF